MGDEQGSPDSWLLNYVVFSPRSGEIAAQGRVYQRPTYGSGTVLGGGRPRVTVTRRGRNPGGMIDYRALEGMGRETAERVLADLAALPAVRP